MKALLFLFSSLALIGLSSQTFESRSHAEKCLICKGVFFALNELLQSPYAAEGIQPFAQFVCTHFHIEDATVCSGAIHLYTKDVQVILSRVLAAPEQACGFIFGPSCSKPYIPLSNWTIPLPPERPNQNKTSPTEFSTAKPHSISILQLSDIHYDSDYLPGAPAVCADPLCCRRESSPKGSVQGAWIYGDYRNCDTPLWTLEDMLSHISKKHKFTHIYLTGDLPAHNIWNQTRLTQIKAIKTVTKLITRYFPGVPIYPAIGNHEISPANSFLEPSFNIPALSSRWLYKDLLESWEEWNLHPDSPETILQAGYYTATVQPGLKVISLNMNYCTLGNGLVFLNTTDPAGMLKWLVDQLYAAELKSLKVHIIGHQMVGACYSTWRRNYANIVTRFQKTITGHFLGHSHKDYYELIYDGNKKPIAMTFVAPSVTPFSFLNMGYRLYHVNSATWMIENHETFIMNLTQAHLTNRTEWQFEYSALEAYHLPDMSPQSWHDLTARMFHDLKLFKLFQKLYYKSHPQEYPCYMFDYCRKKAICQTGFMDLQGTCAGVV